MYNRGMGGTLLLNPLPGFTDGGGGGGGGGGSSPAPASPSPSAPSPGVGLPAPPAGGPAPGPVSGAPGPSPGEPVHRNSGFSPQPQAGQPVLLDGQQPPPAQPGQPQAPGQPQPGPGAVIGAPAVPQPQGQPQGVLGTLAPFFGGQVPFQSEQEAIHSLVSAWQQGQQRNWYSEVGQAVAPHLDEFTAWQQERQRQQAAQQPQGQGEPVWNPPQFDQRLLAFCEEDPNLPGSLRAKPGYDPRIAVQANQYLDYVRESEQLRTSNPLAWGERMFGGLIERKANELIQRHMGQYQEQVHAQGLISQNRHWLYQHDGQGRQMIDRNTGRPALSPNGARYYQYLEYAHGRLGVNDVNEQHRYAMDMLERDAMRVKIQTPAAPAVPAGAQHVPNYGELQGTAPPTGNPAQPTIPPAAHPNPSGASLIQMMRAGLQQDGYTDERLNREMAEPSHLALGAF
jgi:hypothetical protein